MDFKKQSMDALEKEIRDICSDILPKEDGRNDGGDEGSGGDEVEAPVLSKAQLTQATAVGTGCQEQGKDRGNGPCQATSF
jgi:hypothetical protein